MMNISVNRISSVDSSPAANSTGCPLSNGSQSEMGASGGCGLPENIVEYSHLPTGNFSALHTTLQILTLCLILLASLLINSIVFMVFYRKPLLLTISNRFVLNLAASNFIMSVTVMPQTLASAITDTWILGWVWCQCTGMLTTLLIASCIMTLLLISVDRFYAIMKPLHYGMCITAQRASCLLASVWLFSLAIALPPLFGWNHFTYHKDMRICGVNWLDQSATGRSYTYTMVLLCFVIPFGVMCWVYITAFKQAKISIAKVRRNSITAEQMLDTAVAHAMLLNQRRRSSCVSLFQIVNSPLRRRSNASVNSRRSLNLSQGDDWKAAKTGLICMSTFTLCWLPFFVVITLYASLDPEYVSIPAWFSSASIWVAFTSCCLNPLVYVFRNTGIRQQLKTLICGKTSQDTSWLASATNYASTNGADSRRSSMANSSVRLSMNPHSYPQLGHLISQANGSDGSAHLSRSSSVVTFNPTIIESKTAKEVEA